MKTKLLIAFVLLCQFAKSQSITYAYDYKDMVAFQNCTLNIVLTGDSAFDDTLLLDIKKYWTVTKTQVLSGKDLAEALKDDKNFFIGCLDQDQNKYTIASPKQSRKIKNPGIKGEGGLYLTAVEMYVFSGNKHGEYNVMSSCDFFIDDRRYSTYILDYAIKNLNDNFKIVFDNKLSPTKIVMGKPSEAVRDGFTRNPAMLKNRTLLIPEFMAGMLKEKDLQKQYKYKYMFVPSSVLIDSLKSNPKGFCIMAETYEGTFQIYDPVTKEKIFSGSPQKMAVYIKSDQIEELMTAIDSPEKFKKRK